MDDHVCTPPAGEPSIFAVWVCAECGARWEAVENFPQDVTHWERMGPRALGDPPAPKTIDSARLGALLEERAEHYTAEFDRSKEEGSEYAALSFGATALALREVARAIFIEAGA